MALSGTAMLHADNSYSRSGNFDSWLVRNVILIYLPDGTNIYCLKGLRSLRRKAKCSGLKVAKIVLPGGIYHSLVHTLLL